MKHHHLIHLSNFLIGRFDIHQVQLFKWKLSTLTLPNKDLSGVTNDVEIESPLDFHFTEFTFPPKLYFE